MFSPENSKGKPKDQKPQIAFSEPVILEPDPNDVEQEPLSGITKEEAERRVMSDHQVHLANLDSRDNSIGETDPEN